MLSDDEKQRIRAEEEAKFRLLEQTQAERARSHAASAFRAKVAAELTEHHRKARRRTLLLALVSSLGVAVTAFVLVRHDAQPPELSSNPMDGVSGIADAVLVERCQNEVRSRLGEVRFPSLEDAQAQISASSEGKRWDGFALPSDGTGLPRLEFSCRYTPQNDQLELELIRP